MDKLLEIYRYRDMIKFLVRKELKGRYKGSALGFLWTFMNPLLQLIVYTLVFSRIIRVGVDQFYLFLFVALIPWIFFSSCLTTGAVSVINQKEMVKKIYFPREVLPIAHVNTNFINMLLSFVVIFVVLIIARVEINPVALLYLPLVMGVEYLLALGITLLTSAVTVYFRDLEHILGILALAWMYMTPIIYPIEYVPEAFLPLFMANPMTPVIIAFRDILYYGRSPQLGTLLHGFLLGLGMLLIGHLVFQHLHKHFAEEF
jgi:ABC-2 type transport system permease protein